MQAQSPGLTSQEEAVNILYYILIGIVAGWLAGQIMKGSGFGLLGNLVVGSPFWALCGLIFLLHMFFLVFSYMSFASSLHCVTLWLALLFGIVVACFAFTFLLAPVFVSDLLFT